jgi:hypothetical protein
MRHEHDVGRRVHEESIRLQQRIAAIPLPVDEPRGHWLLRTVATLLTAFVLIGLALVLLPPGISA